MGKVIEKNVDLNVFSAVDKAADVLRKKGFSATAMMKALPNGEFGYFISLGATGPALAETMAIVSLGAIYARENEQAFEEMKREESLHPDCQEVFGNAH